VSSHSRAVDHRAAQVQVRVEGDGGGVGLQLGLEHPVLGVGVEGVGGFQLQLQALQQVVLELEAGVEGVVSGPLGDHGDPRAQLLLQLQVTTNLPRLVVGGPPGGDFHARLRLALHIQLAEAEVETFAKDIPGCLAKVGIGWRGHPALLKKVNQA